jgi:hypothetical protein
MHSCSLCHAVTLAITPGSRVACFDMCLLVVQIIVQVAIKAARPAMDASTPETLRRLIAKCWAQVQDLVETSTVFVILDDICDKINRLLQACSVT